MCNCHVLLIRNLRLFALNLKQINVMEKQELIQKIKNILLQIKPYLAADGGGVEFVDLTDDMVVLVELTGACGNCPHSSRTLKNGIEKTIKSILPEIKSVENVK